MHCDYELLLSHSPPPPAPDFLCRPRYSSSARSTPPPPPAVADPSRPCLSPSPAKHAKKRVVFADDKGYSLTQVRVMREPSFAPPSWSLQFLAQVTRDLKACAISQSPADHTPPADQWGPAFAQPASDYLEFRRRLDSGNVSLENVIVRDAEGVLDGTVKVRNLSFHKEVVVRSTPDGWASHGDHVCSYVDNGGGGSAMAPALSSVVLYDTFSFRLPLPAESSRLEFCVCFRCDAGEFWDNNDGVNYAVVKTTATTASVAAAAPPPLTSSPVGGGGKFHDALRAKLDSWSEFASWNHLVNEGPYW